MNDDNHSNDNPVRVHFILDALRIVKRKFVESRSQTASRRNIPGWKGKYLPV